MSHFGIKTGLIVLLLSCLPGCGSQVGEIGLDGGNEAAADADPDVSADATPSVAAARSTTDEARPARAPEALS